MKVLISGIIWMTILGLELLFMIFALDEGSSTSTLIFQLTLIICTLVVGYTFISILNSKDK